MDGSATKSWTLSDKSKFSLMVDCSNVVASGDTVTLPTPSVMVSCNPKRTSTSSSGAYGYLNASTYIWLGTGKPQHFIGDDGETDYVEYIAPTKETAEAKYYYSRPKSGVGYNKSYVDKYYTMSLTEEPKATLPGIDEGEPISDGDFEDDGGSTGIVTYASDSSDSTEFTIPTDTLFNKDNKFDAIVPLAMGVINAYASFATGTSASSYSSGTFSGDLDWDGYIYLDAPPVIRHIQIDASTNNTITQRYYAGISTLQAIVDGYAQYGGEFVSATIFIGESYCECFFKEVEGIPAVTMDVPDITGTYPVSIYVTDTRGQTTSYDCGSITIVNPSISMSVEASRCKITTENGEEEVEITEEGINALFKGNILYSDDIGGNYLSKPQVKVEYDVNGETITDTVTDTCTWYNGDKEISWDEFKPSSPFNLTGRCKYEFNPDYSYRVTVTPSSPYAKEITKAFASVDRAFYLLYGAKGGKALGIGMKTKRDEGLFVGMETEFEENVVIAKDKTLTVGGHSSEIGAMPTAYSGATNGGNTLSTLSTWTDLKGSLKLDKGSWMVTASARFKDTSKVTGTTADTTAGTRYLAIAVDGTTHNASAVGGKVAAKASIRYSTSLPVRIDSEEGATVGLKGYTSTACGVDMQNVEAIRIV